MTSVAPIGSAPRYRMTPSLCHKNQGVRFDLPKRGANEPSRFWRQLGRCGDIRIPGFASDSVDVGIGTGTRGTFQTFLALNSNGKSNGKNGLGALLTHLAMPIRELNWLITGDTVSKGGSSPNEFALQTCFRGPRFYDGCILSNHQHSGAGLIPGPLRSEPSQRFVFRRHR